MYSLCSNVLVLLLGLVMGSFLNCVICRLSEKKSFLRGRSLCPHCRRVLGWQDLVPLASFIVLQGKCRYCRKKISWQYPLVEISTALIFLLIFNFPARNAFGIADAGGQFSIFKTVFLLLVGCFLIVIFVYDLKHYIIPDRVIYPAIVITFVYRVIFNFQISGFLPAVLSGLGAALFFLAIVLVSRGKWMGVGDIKLAFLMGLLLGWPGIVVALFLAFVSGAIIGMGMIVAQTKTLKSEIPFGPFLVLATFAALFLGQRLADWYWGLFLVK